MKQIYFILFFAACLLTQVKAQINRVPTSTATIASQIPGYSQVSTIATKTIAYTPSVAPSAPAPVDGDSTTEDPKSYHYADVLPVSIAMADGNTTSTSLGTVWTLRISIPNAVNIGFAFSPANLSSSAVMYVFDEAHTVLDSAIKKSYFSVNTNVCIFPVKGNSVIIYLLEPNNFSSLQSSFSIQNVEAGYQNLDDVGEQGSRVAARMASIDCIPSVQCYPWHMMSARAVARFISNGHQGTGTLINNENGNGHAYFLTAFHSAWIWLPAVVANHAWQYP